MNVKQQEERREQWRKRIREQEKTSQPIRVFCRERGLKEPVFYAWRQRLRAENKPVSFALIETKLTADAAGLQPAGVSPGGRGGGGGAPNTAMLDLMIEHGADVNAQVTGTRTYSMRISYHPPPDKEGASALHEAVQAGRTDLVRYLLDKGANPGLLDGNGRKPIDLLSAVGPGGGVPAPAAVTGNIAAPAAAGRGAAGAPPIAARNAPAGRGGPGAGAALNPATVAEIRALLQNAAAKK